MELHWTTLIEHTPIDKLLNESLIEPLLFDQDSDNRGPIVQKEVKSNPKTTQL